jgi:hypothetical protein
MPQVRGRMLLAGCLVLLLCVAAGSPPPPATGKQAPRAKAPAPTDHYGDPLPSGALVRIGAVRLRHPDFICSVLFSRDGKTLISGGPNYPGNGENTI